MNIKKNTIPVKCDGCSTDQEPGECLAAELSTVTIFLCELCARRFSRELSKFAGGEQNP